MKFAGLLAFISFCGGCAFAHTSAAELSYNCDSLKATGSEVYSVDRNSKLGFCVGYMNAVFDSIETNPELEVTKNFIVGDMIQCFQRFAPQHHADAADGAIVSALISEGFLKRRTGSPQR